MSSIARLATIASAGILVFDTMASLLSRATGFEYGLFALGSLAIYGLVGAAAYRLRGSVGLATMVAGVVGLTEATLGWYISWMLGPGRPTVGSMAIPAYIVTGVVTTLVIAVLAGQAGARLARRRQPFVAPAS